MEEARRDVRVSQTAGLKTEQQTRLADMAMVSCIRTSPFVWVNDSSLDMTVICWVCKEVQNQFGSTTLCVHYILEALFWQLLWCSNLSTFSLWSLCMFFLVLKLRHPCALLFDLGSLVVISYRLQVVSICEFHPFLQEWPATSSFMFFCANLSILLHLSAP